MSKYVPPRFRFWRASVIGGPGTPGGAPTSPPGGAGDGSAGTPFFWLAADQETYTDAAKTTAAGDGDSVYVWGQLGSVLHDVTLLPLDVTQAVAAARPILRTDYGGAGFSALEFHQAPNTQYLETSGEPDLTGAVTILAAIYLDAGATGGEILNVFQVGTSVENEIRFAVDTLSHVVISRPYSTDQTGTSEVARGEWAIVAARVQTAGANDAELWYDGYGNLDTGTLNDDGVHNVGDLWVGRFDSQFFTDNMDGAIGEILMYNQALTDADMTAALLYLGNRYGV